VHGGSTAGQTAYWVPVGLSFDFLKEEADRADDLKSNIQVSAVSSRKELLRQAAGQKINKSFPRLTMVRNRCGLIGMPIADRVASDNVRSRPS
jgi:hypothetical protein